MCASAGPRTRPGPCTQKAAAFYALARREIDLWMQLEFIVHYQRSRIFGSLAVGRMLYCVLCMLNQYINLHKCTVCMPCLPLKTYVFKMHTNTSHSLTHVQTPGDLFPLVLFSSQSPESILPAAHSACTAVCSPQCNTRCKEREM